MTRTSAESSVEVAVDPHTAFRIFTEEIDLWWVRGPINFYDASRLAELRLEPGVGGRLLEIYDEAAGDVLVSSRITVWEPGRRLVLRDCVQDTEVDISFHPTGTGTRVHVSQYLLPGGDETSVGFGWVAMLPTFRAWARRRDTAARTPREVDRLGLVLYYEDPPAAARWLRDVFQLGTWDTDVIPAEGEHPPWLELHIGNGLLILRPLKGSLPAHGTVTHTPWVHVDDLAAHFAHASARQAKIVTPIRSHGSTTYTAEDLEGRHWTFVQARPTMRRAAISSRG